MNSGRLRQIEQIIENAWSEERKQLFEYEVYAILEILDIRTPAFRLICDEEEITRELLMSFGSNRIVLKAVSRDIAHKAKVGGVKILHKDCDFIKYSYRKMVDSFAEREIEIEKVLIVDYIEYSPELGNEILLGFQESDVFGPVMSFSKGGSDAELFAERFSPPNLLLPPVDLDWARALLSSTEIHNKYIQEGKSDHIDRILELKLKMSELSVAFSNYFDTESSFVLKEFEINPFVFEPDDNIIALDGYAVIDRKKSMVPRKERPDVGTLKPFFHPFGIAVVGVSSSAPDRPGNIIIKNLLRLGRSDVYCVNPRGGEVDIDNEKLPLYQNLMSLPERAELVIVTVPAEAALDVVKQAVTAECGALLLIPGGFSETGRNEELEQQIATVCGEAGIRVMGPNCLGIVYAGEEEESGLNTFFIPETKFRIDFSKERNIALFSQSGALGLVELTNLKKSVSPKVAVSYGNQLDVDPGDLVDYFQDEKGVKVIGVYIEGFKPGAGRRFFEIAGRSRIPIVVYKAGRTKAGRMATQSHTASMAGEYAVAKAAMKQAGMIVADTMADHLGFLKIFAMLHGKSVYGRRIAVVTNAGYEKANAADNLKALELSVFSDKTRNELAGILPSFVTVEPLLDLTPMVDDLVFVKAVEIILAAPEVDAVCVSIVPHAGLIHTTDEEVDSYRANIGRMLSDIAAISDKPMVVSLTAAGGGAEIFGHLITIMETGGLPTYFSAEQAMSCLNEFIRYRLIREQNLLEERIR